MSADLDQRLKEALSDVEALKDANQKLDLLLQSVKSADPSKAADVYRQIPQTLRVETPVTSAVGPEPHEERSDHNSASVYTARAVDDRWSHVEAEAHEAASALERMLHPKFRPASAETRADDARPVEAAPADFGSPEMEAGLEPHSEVEAEAHEAQHESHEREASVDVEYEYQHSFLDPNESLEPSEIKEVKEGTTAKDVVEPETVQVPQEAQEGQESQEDHDPELSAELDAVWESFFPASPSPPPPVAPAEDLKEEVPAPVETAAQESDAVPSAPSAAERSPEPETGETAETEADQEVAEARKVALQAAEAADALKAAREDWLKQFDLSMVNPPPSSPVDIADADHRELTRRERITLLERGLAGEKFSGPPDDENSELRIAEARRHERKAKMQQLWKQKEEAAQRSGPSPEPVTVPAQQAVEELGRHCFEDLRYAKACYSLSRNAHRLSTGSLVRVVEILAAGERAPPETNQLACADAVIGALAPHMTALGLPVLRNCLKVMTTVEVKEQTYLDMLLAQLLVLFRRESGSVPPAALAALAGFIGSLHEAGVSARRGASSASCAANRRCIDTLNELILRHAAEFVEEELATVGSPYLLTFMDDVMRRTILRGAAAIGAGLLPESQPWVTEALVQMEEAVRTSYFAFIASLPDETKDYLMKLKATAASAASDPTEVVSQALGRHLQAQEEPAAA